VRATQGAGKMPDGTSRFRCNGKELFHFMGCSTFSQYTVVAGVSVCAVNSKAPQDKVFNLTKILKGNLWLIGLPSWMWYFNRLRCCPKHSKS